MNNMQGFKTAQPTSQLYCHSSFLLRGNDINRNATRFSDLGDLHHSSAVFQHEDAVDLSSSSIFSVKSSNVVGGSTMQYGTLSSNVGTAEIGSGGGGCMDTGQQMMYHKGVAMVALPLGNGHVENWADSGLADNSQQTDDTSTDIDTDVKIQCNRVKNGAQMVVHSKDQTKDKVEDQKTLRRLAQNREAARKSRLRKKAYVQQLENSRVKLVQLEQELQRARQQGIFIANQGDQGHLAVGNGALAFDIDYAHWVDEHQRMLNDLRTAVNSQISDNELHLLVDGVIAHYNELFRLKSIGAKADVFHILNGMWKTPVERWFMWLGGFRSSELLKIIKNHLEPLTDQQLMGICNLQQSSQQAEDALTQGMEALQQSLVEALSSTSLGPTGSANVADYMGQMAIAMGKLSDLESFLHQADVLKHQTLQQLQRILTTRQTARALLVRNDYISRLRALSSLWLARPRE
ncbi:transcription factor TGA2.2 [Cajanus cajan]|uniref:Transcription factor HBP-1b(C1) n=1 Tax=Cajanus cajan TaxID=3821 RepID=A0A151R469_CAJCA|nr:transcription factor TGA2.2 [Cajanus cajan]XP_029125446.1 transcription factor TGA2.2 [Cajanus cajan]KYP37341.1 Transcription factor HBP-1b(c1) [Cajanus cajan]